MSSHWFTVAFLSAQQSSSSSSPLLCCCSLRYCFVWVSRTSLAIFSPKSLNWISALAGDDTAPDELSSLLVCLFQSTFHHQWYTLVCSSYQGRVHPRETPGLRTDWVSPSFPGTSHPAEASSSPGEGRHSCPRALGDDQSTSRRFWTPCRSEHTWKAWVCVCGLSPHSLTRGTCNRYSS